MTESGPLVQVRCVAVPERLRRTGVRCFALVALEATLSIDGLTVRVTSTGCAVVTWPARKDSSGRHHRIVRIFDQEMREAIERAVLAEAVRGGWLEASRVRCDGRAAS